MNELEFTDGGKDRLELTPVGSFFQTMFIAFYLSIEAEWPLN